MGPLEAFLHGEAPEADPEGLLGVGPEVDPEVDPEVGLEDVEVVPKRKHAETI